MRVKITVLRKEFYPAYAEEYLTEGRAAGPCPILSEGQTFLYEGGAVMPEGFCPWAWTDIYREVSVLAAGGGRENDWYRTRATLACCTDGVRPVIFRLEPLE